LKEEALDRTMWRNRFGRGFGPVIWQITDDDDDDNDDAPAHRSVVVTDFLAKTVWQHCSIPHTLLNRLQLIFTCFLDWNQHWSYGSFVMLLT